MGDQRWNMLRCGSCGRASGGRSGQRSIACRYCGSSSLTIVQSFDDAAQMAYAVSSANLPPEISKEIEDALSHRPELNPRNAGSTQPNPVRIIKSAAKEDGVIDMDKLVREATKIGVDEEEINRWMEMSEIEGALIREGNGEYRLL